MRQLPKPQKAEEATSITTATRRRAVAEPKLDGVRLLAHVNGGTVTFYTRAGHAHPGIKFPSIREELALVPDDTWLDGELWSAEGFGAASGALATNDPQEAAAKAAAAGIMFYVFDLLQLDGIDTRELPLEKRHGYLTRLAEKLDWDAAVRLVPQHPATEATYEAYLDAGFEGAIVKVLDAAYVRTGGWFKVKPTLSEDYVVMDFEDGSGGWSGGPGKIVYGGYRDGELEEVGRVRIKNDAMRDAIAEDPTPFIGRVLEVKFQERTDDGRLRFPRFLRWRPDKPAEECRLP